MIISSKITLIEGLLSANPPDIRQVREELEKIQSTTYRIAKIVKGLLAFSRGGQDEAFSVVSVDTLIDDTLALCQKKLKVKGIDLMKEVTPGLWFHGNSVQISQVLLNLLNNAMDAVLKSKEKWIRLSVRPIDQGLIEFAVVDSGAGIPAELSERIMQPFFTTKDVGQGTGLGLSISKGLVEAHGGQLLFDARSPNTRFCFSLRAVSKPH